MLGLSWTGLDSWPHIWPPVARRLYVASLYSIGIYRRPKGYSVLNPQVNVKVSQQANRVVSKNKENRIAQSEHNVRTPKVPLWLKFGAILTIIYKVMAF